MECINDVQQDNKLFEELKAICGSGRGWHITIIRNRSKRYIYDYVLDRTRWAEQISDSLSIKQRVFLILNGIDSVEKLPRCECGKILPIASGIRYCSAKCMNNSEAVKKAKRESCLKKYGVPNGGGTPEAVKKIKATKLKKYGDENYNNFEKCKETWRKKYGFDNVFQMDVFKEKTRLTCLRKYGVAHHTQLESIQDKRKKNLFGKIWCRLCIKGLEI